MTYIIIVDYEFLLTTKEVAKGFGCVQNTIRQSKKANAKELVLNKHYLEARDEKNRRITKWTKKGIVRLGFLIKSEKARRKIIPLHGGYDVGLVSAIVATLVDICDDLDKKQLRQVLKYTLDVENSSAKCLKEDIS